MLDEALGSFKFVSLCEVAYHVWGMRLMKEHGFNIKSIESCTTHERRAIWVLPRFSVKHELKLAHKS